MADPISENLGHVTAYGFAKAHGYTGTAEEFGRDQATFAESAASVHTDKLATDENASDTLEYKNEALSYKNQAESAANLATSKAAEALAASQNANAYSLSAQNAAASAASDTVNDVTEAVRNLFGSTITASVANGELIFGEESAVTVADGILTIA